MTRVGDYLNDGDGARSDNDYIHDYSDLQIQNIIILMVIDSIIY